MHKIGETTKHLALKNNGEYIQENYRTAGKRNFTFKGLMHRLTGSGNHRENTT